MLYLGEADGARILRVGVGISQLGDDYQLDLTTWDLVPAGDVGDCGFRSIDVAILASNSYDIGITPIVDGVEQDEQEFTGSGSGEFQLQAFLALRGARIAARVRTLSRAGDIEIHSVSASFVILRKSP
jgi:hypothetical protein